MVKKTSAWQKAHGQWHLSVLSETTSRWHNKSRNELFQRFVSEKSKQVEVFVVCRTLACGAIFKESNYIIYAHSNTERQSLQECCVVISIKRPNDVY